MMGREAQHLTAFEPTTSWFRDVSLNAVLQSLLTNDPLEMLLNNASVCREFRCISSCSYLLAIRSRDFKRDRVI